ncbi:MAG: pyridoxamine 5'-phosphate oxidase family protein [Cocleimonas sp.]|nr:pyridoxamine 5'-phosphate oxidase family protein [Cocleimonas sp.]
MGQQYTELNDKLIDFIEQQKLYFIGTAAASSRVNISPKGMDSLRILNKNRVIWLNLTGSGNETAAHIDEMSRMTIMFAAFEGNPLILRLYGTAKAVHQNDAEWDGLYAHFDPSVGARQIFDLTIDLVQSSCGMAVPFFDYVEERDQLKKWAVKKGEEGIQAYWQDKNQISLDGKPTHIIRKNT